MWIGSPPVEQAALAQHLILPPQLEDLVHVEQVVLHKLTMYKIYICYTGHKCLDIVTREQGERQWHLVYMAATIIK